MSQQRRERRQAEEAQPERDPGFLRKVIIGVVIAAALGATYYVGYHRRVHQHDDFARCLAHHDVKMYGAYWCPHCTEQKALFGDAAKDLPYVECDPGGVSPRPDLCEKAGVKSFPTWVMGDKRREGVQSPQALAEFSNFAPETAKPTK